MKPKRRINSFQLLLDASSREEKEIKSAILKESGSNASEVEQDKSKLKPTLLVQKNGQSFLRENLICVQVK